MSKDFVVTTTAPNNDDAKIDKATRETQFSSNLEIQSGLKFNVITL